ncbi:MAG: serine protease [Myxococcota bacterium]
MSRSEEDDHEDVDAASVVRIYATTQRPDYENPWQTEAPQSGTGSGVILGRGRVLTGAHVVADATFLQVQKVSEPRKWTVSVEAINHDCDLALLRVDDPSFDEGVVPPRLGPLPQLRDRVSVVGYPVGGEEISITEGVVSRIEVQRYSHSKRNLLAVTVDAAINEGNSGGPVYLDGEIAGIAFQSWQDAENIGEMVPAAIIERFLVSAERGLPAQIPGLGVSVQNLENPRLRRWAGLGEGQSGVLVSTVESGGSADGVLQPGDALLAIDGHPIADNATIQYRGRVRTTFDAVLGDRFVGDALEVTLRRDGETSTREMTLAPFVALVARPQYDTQPSYFIYGGLVFQPLTVDYLRTWRDWWEKAPSELVRAYYQGTRTATRRELIVLSAVLADEINAGYEGRDHATVKTVNGTVPRDLAHFVEMVEGTRAGAVEIALSDHGVLVLDPAEARRRGPEILARYRVPSDRGPADG